MNLCKFANLTIFMFGALTFCTQKALRSIGRSECKRVKKLNETAGNTYINVV